MDKQVVSTMREWVDYLCGRHGDDDVCPDVKELAARISTEALFAAHSEATIALAGPLRDDDRDAWKDALEAICRELGARIDRAHKS